MEPLRMLPLFDHGAQPASWNERMTSGEYAVHDSSFDRSVGGSGPSCSVFGSLADAEAYANAKVTLRPGLRCRIYDHRGFVGAPLREIRGQHYAGEREISPRFRRWCGSALFLGGLALIVVDWRVDFRLTWPATIGVRLLIPGLLLLVTEAILILHARRKILYARRKRSLDQVRVPL